MRVDRQEFTLVRCAVCGLVYMNPRPGMEELARYYPEEYPPYVSNFQSLHTGCAIRTARLVKRRLMGTARALRVLSTVLRRYPQAPSAAATPTLPDQSEKLVLDFGCGSGANLRKLRREHPHWTFVGFDVATNPLTETLDEHITVYKSSFEYFAKDFAQERFDRIYLNNVLEHLSDPKETLLALSGLLRDGGEMVIEVPNIDSIKRRLFGKYFSSLDLPRHLYHFNPDTLTRMCESAHLELRDLAYVGGSKCTVRSMYYALGIHKERLNPFLVAFFRALAALIGKDRIDDDAIRIVAVKP